MTFLVHLGSAKLRAQRVSEAYRGSETAVARPGFGSLRDIPASVRVLLTNPTFMFLNLAGASEGASFSCSVTSLKNLIFHTQEEGAYESCPPALGVNLSSSQLTGSTPYLLVLYSLTLFESLSRCFSTCVAGMIISGFTTFAPKFVEAQFNISAGIAAQLIGKIAARNDL